MSLVDIVPLCSYAGCTRYGVTTTDHSGEGIATGVVHALLFNLTVVLMTMTSLRCRRQSRLLHQQFHYHPHATATILQATL
jgi:hypothetical protein